MTRPLTPDEILAALKRFGITYREQLGWRTRTNGSGWGDVTGFMWHHTGDDAPDSVDLRIVRDGRAGLPGPLSQFGLRDDGTVDLIAAGAANHAGGGDPLVLAAVSKETYTKYPPKPRFAHGQAGSISGNGRFYGVETYYVGTPDPRAAKTMPRLAAAIIDALDRIDAANTWTAQRAIGHKEWQRGKVDPGGVDCATLRTQTQALLDSTQEDIVLPADIDKIAVAVWRYDQYGAKRQAWSYLQSAAAVPDVAAIAKAVAALVPAGTTVTQSQLETALRVVLGSVDNK